MAKRIIRTWQTMGEALDYLTANTAGRQASEMSSHRRGGEWAGTDTFDEAIAVARAGWNDVRDSIEMTLADIRESFRNVEALVPRMRFDVSGGEVCVPLFLDSEPECMREAVMEHSPKLGRAVKIAIQTSTSGGVSAETILRRGAAVCALVEALALCGVGCEVWAINSISGWDGGIKLSDASDPLDMDAIAFGIAHPAMQRRIYFGLQEQEKDAKRLNCQMGGGYGGDKRAFGYYTGRASEEFLAMMEFDVHVSQANGVDGYVGNMDRDAVAWIRHTITGLGIELQER